MGSDTVYSKVEKRRNNAIAGGQGARGSRGGGKDEGIVLYAGPREPVRGSETTALSGNPRPATALLRALG